MPEIVLNSNLKFIVADLSLTQKGKLLDAILQNQADASDMIVNGIYKYVAALQEELSARKQHMREIGAKGLAVRRQKKALKAEEETDDNAVHTQSTPPIKRKVPKENNKYKYNNNIFIDNLEKVKEEPLLFTDMEKHSREAQKVVRQRADKFVRPDKSEVAEYVKAENLKVDAEMFVDFYDARGWCIGRTAIKNWRAAVRLWHHRAVSDKTKDTPLTNKPAEDENYWHELADRVGDSSVHFSGVIRPVAEEKK